MRQPRVYLLVVTLLTCIACGPGLQVTTIQLGRSVNTDNTVANHTTTFGPRDTVYVSIATSGRGAGTIGVRWMYAGRVVGEPKKDVSYKGAAATEFHLQNAGGFPPGDYSVEVFLNGQAAGTRSFRVEAER